MTTTGGRGGGGLGGAGLGGAGLGAFVVEFDGTRSVAGEVLESKLSVSYRLSTLLPPQTDHGFPLQELTQEMSAIGTS